MVYRPTIPPAGLDADGLRRWTEDEFRGMAQGLSNFDLLQLNKIVAPAGPLQGMLAYADGTTWNPGGGEGLYERVASGWRRLSTPERSEISFNYVPCNAGFNLWQRGASIAAAASANTWFADRWSIDTGANQAHTVSRQTGMGASQFCARVQRNAGQTGVAQLWIELPLDTEEVMALRGKKLSMSALLRSGANFSPAGGSVTFQLVTGTGTPGRLGTTAYPGVANIILSPVALTAAATRFQADAPIIIPVATTQVSILVSWVPVGTAGAADYFEIGEVSLLDITNGTFVAPFIPLPLQDDLSRAMRMYETNMPTISTTPAQNVSRGAYNAAGYNTTLALSQGIGFKTKKRAVPTITYFAPDNAITGIVGTAGRWQNIIAGAFADSTGATATQIAGITDFTVAITANFAATAAYYTMGGWVAEASLP